MASGPSEMRMVRIVGGADEWQIGTKSWSKYDSHNAVYPCGVLFEPLFNEYTEVYIKVQDYFGQNEYHLQKGETLKAVLEKLRLEGVIEVHVRK